MDCSVLSNYKPISNQLTAFLSSHRYFDDYQSSFRTNHSTTETALVKVINNIRLNTDAGRTTVLVLLDLSTAFDTVDHHILLHQLKHWVCFSGAVIKWLQSYLQGRSYFVAIENYTPKPATLTCGVPQRSILGPLLFDLYMLPLGQILRKNSMCNHNYADDT